MNINEAKSEILTAAKDLVNQGLVARTWGNISCRIDEQTFAVTPSGIGYDRLNQENIVVVNMDTGKYEGDIKPTSEKRIHIAAYKADPRISFVIHTHQTYATCLSVSGFPKIQPTADEQRTLGGDVGLGAYALSGTGKLAGIVAAQFSQRKHAVLMAKHGAVLTGASRAEAFERASLLEKICMRSMNSTPDFSDALRGQGKRKEDDTADFSGGLTEEAKGMMTEIFANFPDFDNIMLLSSQSVTEVMRGRRELPAVIDDFAQIIGSEMKAAAQVNPSAKLKGRNAVYVPGTGALCCGAGESDCRAMVTLVEKNALACLNARNNGESPSLSFFDKKLMRFIYTKKYSKKK